MQGRNNKIRSKWRNSTEASNLSVPISYSILIFNNPIIIFACMGMCFCFPCNYLMFCCLYTFTCSYHASLQNLWHLFLLHFKLESLILIHTHYINGTVVYHFIQNCKTLAWMLTAACTWTSVIFSGFTLTNMYIGRINYLLFHSSSLFPSSKILLAAVKVNSTKYCMLEPLNLSFMALLHWPSTRDKTVLGNSCSTVTSVDYPPAWFWAPQCDVYDVSVNIMRDSN